jgi:hypothetical protein
MEEPTSPDNPSTPAQPAAETLAEKHRRRQSFRRLTEQEQAVSDTANAAQAEVDNARPSEPDLSTPLQETSLLDAARQQLRAFGQKARGFAGSLGGRVKGLSQRFTRRAPPELEGRAAGQAPPETLDQEQMAVREAPPARPRREIWPRVRPFLWRGRLGPAFWTVASTLSLVVNVILIVILILLGRQLFFLKETVVSDQLINGLYDNFVLMDQAHIRTTITVSDTIQVKDTIPVVFDLPLSQKTVVTLTEKTPIKGATIYLNNAAVPLDLDLPAGTKLGINLNLTVPVNQMLPVTLNVPVNLTVPVDIPLDQTELHKPFVGLQQVLAPFRNLLADVPATWGSVCKGAMKAACSVLRFK